jgi:hypothetical protein
MNYTVNTASQLLPVLDELHCEHSQLVAFSSRWVTLWTQPVSCFLSSMSYTVVVMKINKKISNIRINCNRISEDLLHRILSRFTQNFWPNSGIFVGSDVLTAVVTYVAIFWDIAPCTPYVNRRFGGTHCLVTCYMLVSCSADFRTWRWRWHFNPNRSHTDHTALYRRTWQHSEIVSWNCPRCLFPSFSHKIKLVW